MKKQLIYLFWLTNGLMLLIGCQKENKPISKDYRWQVSGKILEYGSNKPVPNALVRLRHCESEFLGATTCWTLASDTTDADGNYSFDHTDEEFVTYLDVFAQDYYTLGQEVLVNRGEEDGFNLTINAKSKLNLTFLNKSDSVEFLSFQVSSSDYPNYFEWLVFPTLKDSTFQFTVSANKYNKILYHLYDQNGNQLNSLTDSVICPAHETFQYKISF